MLTSIMLLMCSQAWAICDSTDTKCLKRELLTQAERAQHLENALNSSHKLNEMLSQEQQQCAKDLQKADASHPGVWLGLGFFGGAALTALIVGLATH